MEEGGGKSTCSSLQPSPSFCYYVKSCSSSDIHPTVLYINKYQCQIWSVFQASVEWLVQLLLAVGLLIEIHRSWLVGGVKERCCQDESYTKPWWLVHSTVITIVGLWKIVTRSLWMIPIHSMYSWSIKPRVRRRLWRGAKKSSAMNLVSFPWVLIHIILIYFTLDPTGQCLLVQDGASSCAT